MTLDHVDLFSGIGGFALACKWNGIKTVQFVEIDKFCQKVLNKNFPGVPIHDDIKTFQYTGARPFILTGGFPCQPFSCAGKRNGKEDDRFLWPEMLRVISEVRPRWIIGENVAGIINMELDNCILDMEREGYSVQPFIIPACSVNAPHRRDRVWIVANNNESRTGEQNSNLHRGKSSQAIREIGLRNVSNTENCYAPDTINSGGERNVSDSLFIGLQGSVKTVRKEGQKSHDELLRGCGGEWSEPWLEVATRLCTLDDGLPAGLVRPKGWRVNSLKALGNAIVPQVAFEIMKAILAVEINEQKINKEA